MPLKDKFAFWNAYFVTYVTFCIKTARPSGTALDIQPLFHGTILPEPAPDFLTIPLPLCILYQENDTRGFAAGVRVGGNVCSSSFWEWYFL